MDPVRLESATRDFELFLSRGASLVPEPVYERDTRRHVESLGNRSPLDEFTDGDDTRNEEVIHTVRIDLQARTVETLGPTPET